MSANRPIPSPCPEIDSEAADLIRAEAASHPEWADVQHRYGLLSLAEGAFPEAEKIFRKCLDLNPHYAWARLNLAVAVALRGGADEALELAGAAREAGEGSRALTLAWIHILDGEPGRALEELHRFPQAEGERFDVAWIRSVTASSAGSDAGDARREALRDPIVSNWPPSARPRWVGSEEESSPCLAPGLHLLWHEIGKVQARLGRFEEARDSAHVAYLHWSDRGQYLLLQGFLAGLEGNDVGAARFYHEATDAAPQDAAGPSALAYMYAAAGKAEPAMRYLRMALDRAPGYADLHRQMGLLERRLGHADRAAASFRRALEINPLYATVRLDLAQALFECRDWKGAVRAYERALAAGLASGDLHLHLGRAREMLGDDVGAAGEYRRALEMNPREALAHHRLGGLCRRGGRREEAKDHWRSFLRLTDDPDLRDEVEAILRQEGVALSDRTGGEDSE